MDSKHSRIILRCKGLEFEASPNRVYMTTVTTEKTSSVLLCLNESDYGGVYADMRIIHAVGFDDDVDLYLTVSEDMLEILSGLPTVRTSEAHMFIHCVKRVDPHQS